MIDASVRTRRLLDRIQSVPFSTVDISWLVAFRFLFGSTMCFAMLRTIASGWVDKLFLVPAFRFKYWGFAWVDVLPAPYMVALFWVLAGLALMVALGLFYRFAAFSFAVGFVYLELIDVSNYLNHYYLAAHLAFLLALSPAHRGFSIDSWRRRRSADSVSRLWLYLFRFQIGVVYFFAGFAKAHGDWLIHAQPLRIWLASNADLPLLGAVFTQPWAPIVMSWAGFLFDSTIVAWLLYPKTRPFAYAVVVVFHMITGVIFPIGMFPVIMIVSATVFFEPDWARRVLGAIARRIPALVPRLRQTASVPAEFATPLARGVALSLFGLFCAFELVMPLRFLWYGGNVLWHEQGMRFSWRVMVREKNGAVTFLVRSKTSGRTWQVGPEKYLTRLQERQMSGQPDLVLQLAHHMREDFEARGVGPVEVRVQAMVSLNGRKIAPLIDPSVDLADIRDGLGRATWILPAPHGPPPQLRPL